MEASFEPAKSEAFSTVHQARQWLADNGWLGCHVGGYKKVGGGYATMVATAGFKTLIEFHAEPPH